MELYHYGIIPLWNYAIMELDGMLTNVSACTYHVNLSQLMGLTRKLKLLVLVSLKALS